MYSCLKFKALKHEDKLVHLKSNKMCLNCLRTGHFAKNCRSSHRCRVCHHTILHIEEPDAHAEMPSTTAQASKTETVPITSPHVSTGIKSNVLLMTCRVKVEAPNGSTTEARAMLDSGSSASFITENMAQSLHLPRTKLQLADPNFGKPGKIDVLLGVEIFAEAMLSGRQMGTPRTPVAFDTQFGWVLSGNTSSSISTPLIATHHATLLTGDDLLRRFWEVEEKIGTETCVTQDERAVLTHFKEHHSRSEDGRFVVPLPRKTGVKPLGESRSSAVCRFLSFERSLHTKNCFAEFKLVMDEYFDSNHAEPVPGDDFHKPPQSTFYLPMQAVIKNSSTTTKVRAVFDASAKTSSGISLNDTLLVGPTVHSSLVDVLLRFRLQRVALITDVSRMYRAVKLTDADKDLHRFVWRNSTSETLKDYRMTRVTFGVSSSSFIANMCVKQNAHDHSLEYPMAAKAVEESFYVDDGLTGADTVKEAVTLQQQLQSLFEKAGFLLRKWNSSELEVLQNIDPELQERDAVYTISDPDKYSKTLGLEWNSTGDHLRITISIPPQEKILTKRMLASDIAKSFDVLGWYSPTIILAKILLQQLWETKLEWDDPIPSELQNTWHQWRSELNLLSTKYIPRCYFSKDIKIAGYQLHGFSDASERAYSGVVYFRMRDDKGLFHTSLIVAKTKVAPIKRLTIPRLEFSPAITIAPALSENIPHFN